MPKNNHFEFPNCNFFNYFPQKNVIHPKIARKNTDGNKESATNEWKKKSRSISSKEHEKFLFLFIKKLLSKIIDQSDKNNKNNRYSPWQFVEVRLNV